MRLGLFLCATAMVAAAGGGPAAAQERQPNGTLSYDAAYFRQFAPGTALDIVARVPGFSLDQGATDVRGFGGAAGNLVVNGARPTTKSESLSDVLGRIPASRVLRVEVGPGDLFGAEFSGRPQVLNLVLSAQGGLAGTAELELNRIFSGAVSPEGSVSALLRRGQHSFNASVGVENGRFDEEGTDRLTTLPSDTLIELRRKYNKNQEIDTYVSGSWEHKNGETRVERLNFRLARGWFDLDQTNRVEPATGPLRDDTLTQDSDNQDYELGGDITRPFSGGALKLVGLATRRNRQGDDRSFNILADGPLLRGFIQVQDSVRDEAVARLTWTRGGLAGWTVETGGEVAYNRLKSDVNLFAVDAAETRTRVDLPVDQATVSELRGEGFVNAGRRLSPNLRLDAGLTVETSRLTVRGDARADRSLTFFKPKATLDWQPGDRWQIQASLVRSVAQLDFFDFISAAELTNERVDAGNAELLPQRAWETLLTVNRPILGDGLAKVELGYNRVEQVQDRVPTPEGFDAPGNLGDGTALSARLTLDAPLTRFGIKGGRLNGLASVSETSVVDPYTGRSRRFTGNAPFVGNLRFRQDLGRYAYELGVYYQPPVRFFRRDEIDVPNGADPFLVATAEYRPTGRTTISLELQNLADVPGRRVRTFFRPDRSNPDPFQREVRERFGHLRVGLELKHSFG